MRLMIGSHRCPYLFHLASDKYNMDINLDTIAVELYGKLQTRFPSVEIGDEAGEVLTKKDDVPLARFFEFPYKEDGETLGTITITLDQDDGVIMQIGGDLVDSDVPGIFDFVRSMGAFANKRTMNIKIVNLEKSNLDKRDYEFQAKRKEPEPMETMMESKMYGTAKISYQDLGEARIVIKHTQPVNTELAGGRTMHVERIYIENAVGERFAYPFKHLNGARALAEHIKHGGNPYDPIGKHITGLSEELAQLRKFKGYVGRNEALSEAMGDITSKVMERIETIKKEVQSLQRKAHYESFAESFEDREAQAIPEATMDDWIDRLTIRTFNEDLKSAFPYIFKLVGESELPVKELSAEDLLAEKAPEGWEGTVKAMKKHKEIDNPYALTNYMKNKGMKSHKKTEEAAFESFINGILEGQDDQDGENTLFSDNKAAQSEAINKLNDLLSAELKGGPDGINAIESLKGIIDDPEFLMSLKNIDPDLDTRPLIQQYVLQNAPDVATRLQFGDAAMGGEEPTTPPAPLTPPPVAEVPAPAPELAAAPAPEAGVLPEPVPGAEVPPVPVAEGKVKSKVNAKLKAKFIKAKECGATLNTKMDFGSREMTLQDALKECGMEPEEIGFETGEDGVTQMLKAIAGFWNKEARNFTIGGMRAKIKIKKGFEDGEFPNASPEDLIMVIRKIDELDPSGDQEAVIKLAGVGDQQSDDHRPAVMIAKIGSMSPMEESVTFKSEDSLARIIQLSR